MAIKTRHKDPDYYKKYYIRNKEKMDNYSRRWRYCNPEKVKRSNDVFNPVYSLMRQLARVK